MNTMTAPDEKLMAVEPPRRRPLPPTGPGRGRPTGSGYTFTQRDLSTAIKAAKNAGLENFRIDVDKNGTISVVPLPPGDSPDGEKGERNEWDEVSKPGYKDD